MVKPKTLTQRMKYAKKNLEQLRQESAKEPATKTRRPRYEELKYTECKIPVAIQVKEKFNFPNQYGGTSFGLNVVMLEYTDPTIKTLWGCKDLEQLEVGHDYVIQYEGKNPIGNFLKHTFLVVDISLEVFK